MRVLFASLIPSYWGGSEELWSRAAASLLAQGHAVSAVFALFREAPELDRLSAAGARFHYGTAPPTRWWRRPFQRPRSLAAIFRHALAVERPDLVIFSQCSVLNGVSQILQCRDAGVPYAVINQLVEPLHHDDSIRRNVYTAYSHARKIWFVSLENQEAVIDWLAHELPNASTVPNAYLGAHDTELPWPSASLPLRLALVARLESKQKGHDLLIDALASHTWRQRDLQVTFYGDGPCRESLAERCAYRDLTELIRFGGRATPEQIWHEHHALVLPSRYEGQSLSMLEAMLHGRPVLATPVGGTRGLVIDGETGFLARHCDVEAVKEMLERAWLSRSEWPRLGQTAARRVRGHVDVDPGVAMARRILDACPASCPLP